MTNRPLVSVLIPAYNVGRYIGECLKSVFNQSYDNIEVIVVNDGSTDDIENIISKDSFYDRIKYIKQSNKGVSAARNRALKEATGEYVVFVDADDIVDSEYLEILLSNISGVDVSVCSHVEFPEDTPRHIPFRRKGRVDSMNQCDLIREVLYGDRVSSAPHGKMFKADLISGIRFDAEISVGEDLDYIMKVCRNSSLKARRTGAKLYGYRGRAGSAMNSRYSSAYKGYYDVVKSIASDIDSSNRRLVRAVNYRLFGVASFCISISDNKDDNREYMAAINRTKFDVLCDVRSSVKNRILAAMYVVSVRLTNYLRFRSWQK